MHLKRYRQRDYSRALRSELVIKFLIKNLFEMIIFAIMRIQLKRDNLDTFDTIETGHVLYFAKLQNCLPFAGPWYVIRLKTYVFVFCVSRKYVTQNWTSFAEP